MTVSPTARHQCGLSDRILKVIEKNGWENPLPVQVSGAMSRSRVAQPGMWHGACGKCRLPSPRMKGPDHLGMLTMLHLIANRGPD